MRNFGVIFLSIIIFSCSKNDEAIDTAAALPGDNSFNLVLKDSIGNDLLDPDHPNTYNLGSIKTFEIIDGDVIEIYNPRMDAPRGYFIFENYLDENVFGFSVPGNETSLYRTFLLEWNNQDTDTIEMEYETIYNRNDVVKIYYNNEKKWDLDDAQDEDNPNNPIYNNNIRGINFFEVIKD